MNFLDRWDEKRLEVVLDSQKRKQQIKTLGGVRPMMFWCMVVLFVVAIGLSSFYSENAVWFGVLLPCFCYFLTDQELRLLKLVDRVTVNNTSTTEPPTAN